MIPENYGNKNYFYIYIDNHIIIIYIKNKKWVFSSKVLKSERVARFFFYVDNIIQIHFPIICMANN